MLVSSLFDRVTTLLQDDDNVRWTETELLQWLSDGQRTVVLYKPEAQSTVGNIQTVAGTKQTLPAAGLVPIDVIRNMGVGGTTPGRVIRRIEREILDAQRPNWHTETGTEVKHWMLTPADRKTFFIYPALSAQAYIEVVYAIAPGYRATATGSVVSGDVTATTQYTSLDDLYADPLVNYVMFRAYSKDAKYAGNAAKAQAYYTLFANVIGIRTSGERAAMAEGVSGVNPLLPGQG